ncbi:DUF2470 domain-containing protein [Nocardioides marmorisolisilvae]|uniref:DUF2470 domain-containing protein n=1 Tax=Nocardioides marmorisolisilvae TaxID=1542737 RepID=A0A3N0DIX9_9ACTN|nr:DUF2470 domain-containing protein [Nocardioides marmorisolisilvae]RNL75356.1 DUF2470 domain-containing protein [Nocardioides marmorisolisilvae]
MRSTTIPTLTPAERARTIVATASTLRVQGASMGLDVHRHGVVPDGSVLFQAPPDLAESLAGRTATATAVDVATVPQADRIRGTVTLAGPVLEVDDPLPVGLRAHLTGTEKPDDRTRIVRLVPERIGLTWNCERRSGEPPWERVKIADYRVAHPDPLLSYEAEWLPHLQADHGQVLSALASYELGVDQEPEDVRALSIDRYGLVLRVSDHGCRRDLRIAFDRPACCGCDVREALSAMVERAVPGAGPLC